jgi:hypothetical protein
MFGIQFEAAQPVSTGVTIGRAAATSIATLRVVFSMKRNRALCS